MPDFPEMERRLLDFWREIQAFQKLREKNRGKQRWNFLDGPITANNPMGVHHAWGRSYKDMFQRYHAMNGYDQRYQNGFDCQGLWVEVEVEKEHGFQNTQDILDYGIDKFVRDCKERVLQYAAKQTEQSVRLGYWTDWDDPDTLLKLRQALKEGNKTVTVTVPSGKEVTAPAEEIVAKLGSAEYGGSYFTFSDENNYTIWSFLKKCHQEDFIYRGADGMPWCCRCGTGLSQMEVTEGRKIVKHTAVFVRFPLRGRDKEALLVWTTTPWTLTSNVAAAVNPDMTYLKVRHGDWTYYLGKENFTNERLQNLEVAGKRVSEKMQTLESMLKGSGELEVLGELKGEELIGWEFDGPFDHFEAQQRPGGLNPYASDVQEIDKTAVESHRVIPWKEVSGAEGTGIVHIAPGCGSEDYQLGLEHGLPAIAPLDASGHYLDGFAELSGRMVLTVADDIVQDLRERGLLVSKEAYPHVYPHCWRCKQELVFRLVDEWYIRMDWRDRIQKIVGEIRWIPPDGEAREQDWLKNMGDWMISKKRFWGLALPIWTCDECGWFDVIGGRQELKARAVEGWDQFEGHTPHRPWIDEVKIKCEKCGEKATRIKDVGNPWLDAGIVPYSTMRFNTDHEYWEKWFPADFVVESFPGQFRNWFYALLAMSAMMTGRRPFKTLLGHALVRDARGEEMHKSAGNAIAFDEAAEVLGAEVMRYIYAEQNPVHNLNFPDLHAPGSGKGTLDAEVRRRLLTLWNCYSFFITYASVDDWRPAPEGLESAKLSELDRWILSRLQNLIQEAHDAFGDFSVYRFMRKMEQFEDEFSNWYLRRSRRRFWKPESDDDKQAAYTTLFTVLETLTRVLAPILPFLSEEIYQNLVRSVDESAPESVHLRDYPQADQSLIDQDLERRIDCVIRTKEQALKLRAQSKVKIRQPLGTLIVRPRDKFDAQVLQDEHFASQVLDECNLKEIQVIPDEKELVSAAVKPNFKTLGPRYGRHMKAIASFLGQVDPDKLQSAFERGQPYTFQVDGADIELDKTDVEMLLEGPAHLTFLSEQGAFAALDTTITPELELEGLARDVNRAAQDQRKALDLNVADRIHVRYQADGRVAEAIQTHLEWLKQELLALTIESDPQMQGGIEAKAGSESLRLAVEKA
ncbi:MAG TPA: class I tRNA ligase family protein [Acidobacteriota bacterium]|nr:class I tRNA ligase family protein [Acidobacteriota bacterium]